MTFQENERIAQLWFEAMWSMPDYDHIVDEIIHPDFSPDGIPLGKNGPAQIKDEIKEFRSTFPDLRYEIIETAALSDRIWVRYKATGTQKGSFLGFAPTGNAMEYEGVVILYIKDHKVIYQWGAASLYDMLTTLGLVPPLWALKEHLRWPR